jgi:hypothetical protein
MKVDDQSLYQEYMLSQRHQPVLVAGDKVYPADDSYAMPAESVVHWDA